MKSQNTRKSKVAVPDSCMRVPDSRQLYVEARELSVPTNVCACTTNTETPSTNNQHYSGLGVHLLYQSTQGSRVFEPHRPLYVAYLCASVL